LIILIMLGGEYKLWSWNVITINTLPRIFYSIVKASTNWSCGAIYVTDKRGIDIILSWYITR
jgi:hypothetical protein